MMMRMGDRNPSDTFQTRDLWLAAALLASGQNLVGLVWHDGRAYFAFEDIDGCNNSADKYWSRELQVKAKDFADALRTLKDRLHGGAPRPRGARR